MSDKNEPIQPVIHNVEYVPLKSQSLSSLDKMLKEVYEQGLKEHLDHQMLFFGPNGSKHEIKEFAPYVPTFKERWKTFWNHIPDFFAYLKNYKYQDWKYYDHYEGY